MKTKLIIICGIIFTAAILTVVLFYHPANNHTDEPVAVNEMAVPETPQEKTSNKVSSSKDSAGSESKNGSGSVRLVPHTGRSAVDDATSKPEDNATAAEQREQKLENWDALVDRIAEMDDVNIEVGRELKKALNDLDPKDKLPALSHALNLVPDEGFAAFVPILFDKSQPEEILDEIFSDALNREESIKVPLMKELRKDKSHPMFFESARILDATNTE